MLRKYLPVKLADRIMSTKKKKVPIHPMLIPSLEDFHFDL